MIELPFPAKQLSPNARIHPMQLHTCKKRHKNWAYLATKAAGVTVNETGDIRVIVTAYPPGRYRYDRDNFIARCKAYFDGIALALGVDDSRFDPRVQLAEPVKNGRVTITVEAA